jgi:hypothetical protein
MHDQTCVWPLAPDHLGEGFGDHVRRHRFGHSPTDDFARVENAKSLATTQNF